jgi:hypothetical protein
LIIDSFQPFSSCVGNDVVAAASFYNALGAFPDSKKLQLLEYLEHSVPETVYFILASLLKDSSNF